MTLRRAITLAGMLGFVLILAATGWAQQPEQPPLSVTGRIVFGFGDYTQGEQTKSGPASTLESDVAGYWRDPRILQFDVKPMISLGTVVPGTEMGNALTGFNGTATVLQGSAFPLTVSYSRTGSTFGEQSFANQGILTGVNLGTTNEVFDVNWMLRIKNLPTLRLDYRDTNNNIDLPSAFGGENAHNIRDFTAHLNYNRGGWQAGGWYQHTESTVKFPSLFTRTVEHDTSTVDDYGFNASRTLPLQSIVSASADQSISKFSFDGVFSDVRVRNANVTLTSRPVERLSTTLQALYTSNLQGYQLQQVVNGAGVVGTGTPNSGSTIVPPSFLAAPFDTVVLSAGAGLRIGYGFSLSGSVGESHSSHSGSSGRWSAGPAYQHKWRSGSFAASYSHSHTDTRVDVLSAANSGAPFVLFSQVVDADTGTVNLNQNLPGRFEFTGSAHTSVGTLKDNGLPLPYHEYGGLGSLARRVGEWTFTGALNVERNDDKHELIFNENHATGVSLGVGYRGLSVSAGRQYGTGLALQLGDQVVFVNNPVVVSPLLGVPVLTTTRGTTVSGSYRSRRDRLNVTGYFGRFSYVTDSLQLTRYTLVNARASYKLRRLRLVAGYTNQKQFFGAGPLNDFRTRLVYFQIERVFRVY